MGLEDGLIVVCFKELTDELLKNSALFLADSQYSAMIRKLAEEFSADLEQRANGKSKAWHTIDLTKFSEAELILAETQFEILRDEVPERVGSLFSTFRFCVHNELVRRSTPERQ